MTVTVIVARACFWVFSKRSFSVEDRGPATHTTIHNFLGILGKNAVMLIFLECITWLTEVNYYTEVRKAYAFPRPVSN